MQPITNEQLSMIGIYLRFIGYQPIHSFTLRDITLLRRAKGRTIAIELPGIGQSYRWLDRRTDDY